MLQWRIKVTRMEEWSGEDNWKRRTNQTTVFASCMRCSEQMQKPGMESKEHNYLVAMGWAKAGSGEIVEGSGALSALQRWDGFLLKIVLWRQSRRKDICQGLHQAEGSIQIWAKLFWFPVLCSSMKNMTSVFTIYVCNCWLIQFHSEYFGGSTCNC